MAQQIGAPGSDEEDACIGTVRRPPAAEKKSWFPTTTFRVTTTVLAVIIVLLLVAVVLQLQHLGSLMKATSSSGGLEPTALASGSSEDQKSGEVTKPAKFRQVVGKPGTAAKWAPGSQASQQFAQNTWKKWYTVAEKMMDRQWDEMIWPVIQGGDFSSVLEVAAGACRNTEKLVKLAGRVVVTDIDKAAVESCRQRFAGRPSLPLEYHVVDGTHLPVADDTVSFVYQFDAGVHFHSSIIRAYMAEFSRVLMPGGTGFFHHSNLGESQFPVVGDSDVSKNTQWRSNMTKTMMRQFAKEAGLVIWCHPRVTWGKSIELDAFALFYKPGAGQVPSVSCPDVIAPKPSKPQQR